MRIQIRPRLPVLVLLLFAPAIPELLTGSTPITGLVVNPLGFAIDFAVLIGLYGGGALLIREFAVAFHKGWASILLLGAAYGIAEEGFAVHTFFQPSGAPVGALATYGHAYGVNWLWALGLTAFHATYSIALPILLVGLWFPEVRSVRWLDRSATVPVALAYLAVVAVFAHLVGHGPSPAAFALFLGIALTLIALAVWAPAGLLSVRPGPARASPLALVLVGTGGFDAWFLTLLFAGRGWPPAEAAATILVGIDLAVIAYLLLRVGGADLERSEFYFSSGMLVALFAWDFVVELTVPGILAVAALFAYLQYRLGRRVTARSAPPVGPVPPGVRGAVPPPNG